MPPAEPASTPEESHEWMFKLGDLLLGPVTGKVLIKKLYGGEVTRETMVAPPGGKFQRLGGVELFRVHLAKAEAKLRVDEESRVQTRQRKTTRNLRMVAILSVTAVAVAGAIWGARWLAVNKPWKRAADIAIPEITVDLPTITVASASRYAVDEVLLPGRTTPKSLPATTPGKPGTKPGGKPGKGEAALAMAAPPKPGAEDDLTRPQYDGRAINEIVNENKKSLFPCLVEEVRRRPGFAAKIPIEFAIGNEGRVVKLWIDHPDFKSGDNELQRCMLGRLQQWKFPGYQGERATVALSFNIGAR